MSALQLIDARGKGRNWASAGEVETETAAYIHWFNTERIHSSIEYMTPIEREMAYARTIAKRDETN